MEMERVICRVLLYEGRWGHKLSYKAIESVLRHMGCRHRPLASLRFVQPDDDVAFEVEVVFHADLDWGDQENICDRIIERLLTRFEPEYESMIEVEVE
jgi:divalent metal cation (Fe/Co/Zn/Cd) transporter